MAAGPDAIWVATGRNRVGELWRSPDGRSWSPFQTFPGATLHGIGIYQGQVYAGVSNAAGGVLLGPGKTVTAGFSRLKTPSIAKDLPRARPLPKEDPASYLAMLKTVLADPEGYDRSLRIRFAPLALSDDPAIGQALGRPFPEVDATMLGSRRFPAPKMARWCILWAMAHNGHGRVPPALIAAPWEAPQKGAKNISNLRRLRPGRQPNWGRKTMRPCRRLSPVSIAQATRTC